MLENYLLDHFNIEIAKLKYDINDIKKEISLIKNKENDKCVHGLEKHIECNTCNIKCIHGNKIHKHYDSWIGCAVCFLEKIECKPYKETLAICIHQVPVKFGCEICNSIKNKNETFGFMEIIKKIKLCKKARRKLWLADNHWKNSFIYYDNSHCSIKLAHKDLSSENFINGGNILFEDYFANDWEIFE